MSRPFKCRKVASIPGVTYYKPAGVPLRLLKDVKLTVEEAEALRLKDIELLEQELSAVKMNISRATFQRILTSARRKVADALLNGKAIRIEGGNFKLEQPVRLCCQNDPLSEPISIEKSQRHCQRNMNCSTRKQGKEETNART